MDTDDIPQLPAGETALVHAKRLVIAGTTEGAVVVPRSAASHFCSSEFRVLVQRYVTETNEQEELRSLSNRLGCRMAVAEGVRGVVRNYKDVDGTPPEQSWDPVGDAEEYQTPDGRTFRLETPSCVFCVVEAAEPRQLARVFDEWVDPWDVPVVLLSGNRQWPDDLGPPPGNVAVANLGRDADGAYFATYTMPSARGQFAAYLQTDLRVHPVLFGILPG